MTLRKWFPPARQSGDEHAGLPREPTGRGVERHPNDLRVLGHVELPVTNFQPVRAVELRKETSSSIRASVPVAVLGKPPYFLGSCAGHYEVALGGDPQHPCPMHILGKEAQLVALGDPQALVGLLRQGAVQSHPKQCRDHNRLPMKKHAMTPLCECVRQ